MSNKIILGFDVGSNKYGVAVGQTLTQQAKPLERLPAKRGKVEAASIKKLLQAWKPQLIVVGIPVTMDGNSQFTTELAQQFVLFLKTLTPIPVDTIDERLTTKIARSEIFEQGGFKQLQKSDIDGYAAKLMVECWMREHPQKS